MKHIIQPGAGYKVISSGTSNRSVSIVAGYKISGPIPIRPACTKENHDSPLQQLEDRLKRSSRYPVIPGLPNKAKLTRHCHVKKPSREEKPLEETVVMAESPVQTTPDEEMACLTPTKANMRSSLETPAWARPTQSQRYPSTIFDDYYNDESSSPESPLHSIEEIAELKEHEAWGDYWNEKMDNHAAGDEDRPRLQRAGTLEVAQLLKNRRIHVRDFRHDSLSSMAEEDEL